MRWREQCQLAFVQPSRRTLLTITGPVQSERLLTAEADRSGLLLGRSKCAAAGTKGRTSWLAVSCGKRLRVPGQDKHCLRGLITNISDPITTKVSPHGKSWVSSSWGKQAQKESEGKENSYWVQPLLSSHIWGNTVRLYQTYEDFMASANHKDFIFASSYSHPNAIEGPSAVLYSKALYYNCYRSADVCRYDLEANEVKRVTLPGTGVGFNNKFPYCYYDCRLNSDVDVEADETGLWALYATLGNHGNMVISRLVWDSEVRSFNVTQTWETRLFKKAVSNAFMVCGVMYATRYVNEYQEEVFYAFDTATGKEDNSLAIRLEKVAKGVASLSYNPTNKQIYMYNDGYLLAYQAYF
ncbi:olfactomedin-4-like [Oreochromis niloticus]|uniref:olfactomedin-4-like n=1 Tax=Oreochromis niloticus TaxID=8128 RepID=UPI000904A5A7|nr:olfactomedin-4-like [Oreochromis niloticus]